MKHQIKKIPIPKHISTFQLTSSLVISLFITTRQLNLFSLFYARKDSTDRRMNNFISSSLPLKLLLLLSATPTRMVESFVVIPAATTISSSSYSSTSRYQKYRSTSGKSSNGRDSANTVVLQDTSGRTPPFFLSEKEVSTTKDEERTNNNDDEDEDTNLVETQHEPLLQQIEATKKILVRAAETKKEDPDVVVDALLLLEKLSRKANKADPSRSERTLTALAASSNGSGGGGVSWRLIFTTGTVDTQRKLGGTKINYFPLKATQSFDNTNSQQPWVIQNGIYAGENYALVNFQGDFDWTLSEKSGLTKVTFDFDRIQLFNGFFDIPLKNGQAASLGSKTGLGSDNNVKLNKKGKRPFFDWISADAQIATARGGGGGLALWKRI